MTDKKGFQFFSLGTWTLGITAALHLIGHLLGSRRQPVHPKEIQLLEIGHTHLIDFGGIQRTFMDMYNGFSLSITLFCAFLALLLHLIHSQGKNVPGMMHKAAGISLLFNVALFAISVVYLILPPIILFGFGTVFFLLAWLKLPKT